MKILFINHVAALHGATLSLFTTLAGLKELGIEPVLVVPCNWPWDKDFSSKLESLHIPYYKALVIQSIVSKKEYQKLSLLHRCYFWYNLCRGKRRSFIELSKIEVPEGQVSGINLD